ncbi:MAG: WYL domain-containing protein, partial [Anaerolineae bacterium]|nr:WYL domain-containing protein [Anaerolineae bacterium]
TLHAAVQADRRVVIAYNTPYGGMIETEAAPYGLVAKAGIWYVVLAYHHRIAAMRVSAVQRAEITDEPFIRPADFDLATFWQDWCSRVESNRPEYCVRLRVAPELLLSLRQHFGHTLETILEDAEPPDERGWRVMVLPFESFEAARERILGYGRAVEVLEPHALRCSVIDFARQIVDFYAR